MFVGWNPMMSHGTPQAVVNSKDGQKSDIMLSLLIRLSETARIADIHLALRPGTDALLFKAMISIIIKKGGIIGNILNSMWMDLKRSFPGY